MIKIRLFKALASVVLIGLLSACGSSTANTAGRKHAKNGASAKPGKPAVEAVPVEVKNAVTGSISSSLQFNSTIETETSVEVYPQTSGLVKSIEVEEGDHVKAGDPLLHLEDQEILLDLKQAQVSYERLKDSFDRNADLFKRGMINKQDYETQKFQLDQAKLDLERAKLHLDQTVIRAPVTGVITNRLVQIGSRVTQSTQLFGMMRLNDMIARVYVPGRYLTAIKDNQQAEFTSDFLPGKVYPGYVRRISPIVDPKSGTFKVTVGLKTAPGTVPPGLFVNVKIITDTHKNTVLVPKDAVVYEGGERYVFVVKNGVAVRTKLGGGYENGDSVEALSGVSAGEPVIVLGQNGLRGKTPVRVVKTPDTPAPAVPAVAVDSPKSGN